MQRRRQVASAVGLPRDGRFTAPGHLEDLLPEHRQGWSSQISDMMDRSAHGEQPMDDPRPQFFNPIKKPVDSNSIAVQDIQWRAFPRRVTVQHGNDEARWSAADADRNVQDEYCEWSVERNNEGKITRITFTCEGPEYWEYLAKVQPATVLELYREHVNPKVEMTDLFDSNGSYIPQNKWNNTTSAGAMHLIMGANTLSAEVELAAAATILRWKHTATGKVLMTDPQDLINCGLYGAASRHSDPHIGAEVNAFARKKALITLADPVGLYFNAFNPVGFKTPDGADARSFMTWTRGSLDRYLRGVFEVPKDKPYVVGDIEILGAGNIEYGAQVADYLSVKLTGLVAELGQHDATPKDGCNERKTFAAFAATPVRPGRLEQEAYTEDCQVYRYVVGIDKEPQLMDRNTAAQLLQDPFAQLVLLSTPPSKRPLSLADVSQCIEKECTHDGGDVDIRPSHEFWSFYAGDGGQMNLEEYPDLARYFRFVWVRKPSSSVADIMVVAGGSVPSTSKTTFLQVAAWDSVNRVFNYYQRDEDNGWVWVGNSMYAFRPETRGKGPFDGHVNGSLVMKELSFPWSHWHSSAAHIDDSCVPDPVHLDPFFTNRRPADDLERLVVKPGIAAWTSARLDMAVDKQADGTRQLVAELGGPKALIRQVLTTTTINLKSSSARSKSSGATRPNDQDISLPATFFINQDGLSLVFKHLKAKLPSVSGLTVPYSKYQAALESLDVHLYGETTDRQPVKIPGDTHFAFLVPEPAYEDVIMIHELLNRKWLSASFLLCCLMVDFPNPVYSRTREELMRYIPDTGDIETLETDIVANIMRGEQQGHAPAKEFMKWWNDAERVQHAEAAIAAYLTAAQERCKDEMGIRTLLSMANHRRWQFTNGNEELDEFALTLPKTSKPLFAGGDNWRFNEKCLVEQEATAHAETPRKVGRLHCSAARSQGESYRALA